MRNFIFHKKNFVCVGCFNEPVNAGDHEAFHQMMLKLKPGQYLTMKYAYYGNAMIETRRLVCVGENQYHWLEKTQSSTYVTLFWNTEHNMVSIC